MAKNQLIIPKLKNNFNDKLIKEFNIELNRKFLIHKVSKKLYFKNKPYDPSYDELFFLHNLVTLNKRLTILEIGSGWSTLFFSHALNQNKMKYQSQSEPLRGKNKFELFVLENEKKYLEISKRRIEKNFKKNKTKIHWSLSEVKMSELEGRYCTIYSKFPKVSPDFIYLDGPDQFKVKGNVNKFNSNHEDLMPMVSDLIKIEFYLKPGTILVVDGRAANVQFLRSFFKRKWEYYYVKRVDKHILFLNAESLGEANNLLIKFYKKK